MYVYDFSCVIELYVFMLVAYRAWNGCARGKCELKYCKMGTDVVCLQ